MKTLLIDSDMKEIIDDFFSCMILQGRYKKDEYQNFINDILNLGQAALFKIMAGTMDEQDLLDLRSPMYSIKNYVLKN